MKIVTLSLTAIALAFTVACKSNADGSKTAVTSSTETAATNGLQTFDVRGVVQSVTPAEKKIVIRHEEIPNYMPAMTMPFDVKSADELAEINAGDEVSFRMLVTETDGWIDSIRKTGASVIVSTNAQPELRGFRQVRDVDPLEIGDQMPDYSFTNSFGKKVSFSDFKGQALAFTFIFTRCPFPNFCPRMNSNFQQAFLNLKERSDGPTNWHLFSISFDPDFDTPERLRAYSEHYSPDPDKWDWVTGAMIDIDAITEQFGLGFAKRDGTINHNLRTVVVDANGKVQQIFIGNEWKPEELSDEIVKAAKVKSP